MTRDVVLDLLKGRSDAILRRDFQALGALYSSSARLESPLAGAALGRQAIIAASQNFFFVFPDAVITEEAPIIDGSRASIVASVAGTKVGAIMGLEPTERDYRFSVAFILEFADDLIARERRLYDFTGLLVQIGAIKAKPA